MANGQERTSIKEKLSKLHCPFTWEILDNMIKHSIVYHRDNKDENDQMMDDETSHPLEQLLLSLFKCYKAMSSADKDKAAKKIEKAEGILIQVQQEYDIHNTYLFILYF